MDLGLEYVDDDSPTLLIASFDPGVTTGWAVHRVPMDSLCTLGFREASRDPRFGWASGQLAADPAHGRGGLDYIVDEMVAVTRAAYVLGDYVGEDVFMVAMEGFSMRIMDSQWHTLAPVRVAEKYEYWKHTVKDRVRFGYVHQSASDAKNVVSDARLKTWNLYKPGSEHARDAQRHGVLAARRWSSDPRFRSLIRSTTTSSLEREREV